MDKKNTISQSQDNVIFVLRKYPNEMIMHNGWLTGGHGIQFDMRTINSLVKRGIIINGKLSEQNLDRTKN